ncbi:hypothetical protein ACQ3G7_07810 [Kosakonia oryzendophytica]|uniref:hypothetical protein n=1 Tax=Kosakonia oryzendophytica TaxID=1005665 RepID=UPI003D326957
MPGDEIFPCSPFPFINERVNSNWFINREVNRTTYNKVAYDFDGTIYIQNSTSSHTGIRSLNVVVINYMLHDLKSGKHILIISNRPEKYREEIRAILRNVFDENVLNEVTIILLGDTKEIKAKYIEANNIRIFYGDSDSDMKSAIMGGAIPVRVLRNINSLDRNGANVGLYQELIMGCSQRAY